MSIFYETTFLSIVSFILVSDCRPDKLLQIHQKPVISVIAPRLIAITSEANHIIINHTKCCQNKNWIKARQKVKATLSLTQPGSAALLHYA